MIRKATVTKLKPGAKEAYKKLHDEIWNEVVAAGHAANIRNFTIFCQGDYLFSYYEYTGENFDEDIRRKNSNPAVRKWQETTGAMTEPVVDGIKTLSLEELWHNEF